MIGETGVNPLRRFPELFDPVALVKLTMERLIR
jgi:hypothetical protein